MKPKTNIQSGFTLVETLLVVLILSVISFGGYYVWHAQHQNSSSKATSSTAGSSTKTNKSSSQPVSKAPAVLNIKELGISLPLTAEISDLTYKWDANTSGALIGSPTLAKDAATDDPEQCTATGGDPSNINSSYPIGSIVSKAHVDSNNNLYWQPAGSPGGPEQTVAINGHEYYWYPPHAGSGCWLNPTGKYDTTVDSYNSAVQKAFQAAKAD